MNINILEELIEAGISFGVFKCYSTREVVCTASIRKGRWVFENEATGEGHSIAAEPHISSPERVIAHWRGFLAEAGYSVEDSLPIGPIGSLKASSIKELISDTYQDELSQVRSQWPCVASRGKWFMRTSIGDADTYETDTVDFKGTKKEILAEIAKAEATPSVTELYIDGGIDAAESVRDLTEVDGSFVSWAGEWSILIWKRPEAN